MTTPTESECTVEILSTSILPEPGVTEQPLLPNRSHANCIDADSPEHPAQETNLSWLYNQTRIGPGTGG